MKKNGSRKTLCLGAAAFVLLGSLSVGRAYGYFTTYVETGGNVVFQMGETRTEIKEEVRSGMKLVSIRNTGDYACYVRVRAFAGSTYQDQLRYEDSDGIWTDGKDGYWYYGKVLPVGETSGVLRIQIPEALLKDVTADRDLNVIVIQECTPESYDESGVLLPNGPERFRSGEDTGR